VSEGGEQKRSNEPLAETPSSSKRRKGYGKKKDFYSVQLVLNKKGLPWESEKREKSEE